MTNPEPDALQQQQLTRNGLMDSFETSMSTNVRDHHEPYGSEGSDLSTRYASLLGELHKSFALVECKSNCKICIHLMLKLIQHIHATHVSSEGNTNNTMQLQTTESHTNGRKSRRIRKCVNYNEELDTKEIRDDLFPLKKYRVSNARKELNLYPEVILKTESNLEPEVTTECDLTPIEFDDFNVNVNDGDPDYRLETDHEEKYCLENFDAPPSEKNATTEYQTPRNRKPRFEKYSNKLAGEKRSVCKICNKSYRFAPSLSFHMRSHTGQGLHTCNECGKVCNSQKLFTIHMRLHTGERPFVCEICGKDYLSQKNLTTHKRFHGKKPYVCNQCGKAFVNRYKMEYHVKIHTGEKNYVCETCGKRFRLKELLALHNRKHTGEKPYSCNICDYRCAQFASYNYHLKTHKKELKTVKFDCTKCNFNFVTRSELDKHLKTSQACSGPATGEKEKINMCDQCGKCFTRKSRMNAHKRFHTTENESDMKPKLKEQQIKFKVAVKTETGETIYRCRKCDLKFSKRYQLYIHMKIHPPDPVLDAEKTNMCDHCGRRFKLMQSLTNHVQTCTGVDVPKPSKCRRCNLTFPDKQSLKVHSNSKVHRAKSFVCNICSQQFNRADNLKVHKQSHENNKS